MPTSYLEADDSVRFADDLNRSEIAPSLDGSELGPSTEFAWPMGKEEVLLESHA